MHESHAYLAYASTEQSCEDLFRSAVQMHRPEKFELPNTMLYSPKTEANVMGVSASIQLNRADSQGAGAFTGPRALPRPT